MEITVTPTQATKAERVLSTFYNDRQDPDIAALIEQLNRVIASRPQEAYCACGCGELVTVDPKGRPKKYFSDRCRQQAYRNREKEWKYSSKRVNR